MWSTAKILILAVYSLFHRSENGMCNLYIKYFVII